MKSTNSMKWIFVNCSISIMSFQIFNYKILEILLMFFFLVNDFVVVRMSKNQQNRKDEMCFFLWYRHHSNHKFPPRNSIFFVDLFSVLHTRTQTTNKWTKKEMIYYGRFCLSVSFYWWKKSTVFGIAFIVAYLNFSSQNYVVRKIYALKWNSENENCFFFWRTTTATKNDLSLKIKRYHRNKWNYSDNEHWIKIYELLV